MSLISPAMCDDISRTRPRQQLLYEYIFCPFTRLPASFLCIYGRYSFAIEVGGGLDDRTARCLAQATLVDDPEPKQTSICPKSQAIKSCLEVVEAAASMHWYGGWKMG